MCKDVVSRTLEYVQAELNQREEALRDLRTFRAEQNLGFDTFWGTQEEGISGEIARLERIVILLNGGSIPQP
jgi:hypothetical protein